MFRALQHPWQSGSFEILIGGFQKGKARPCTSRELKLQDVQVWSKNLKIWHPVTLVPPEVQGRVLPFWKPLINIFKELDCHGCFSALNISQAMLKIAIITIIVSRLMHRTVHTHQKAAMLSVGIVLSMLWCTYKARFFSKIV